MSWRGLESEFPPYNYNGGARRPSSGRQAPALQFLQFSFQQRFITIKNLCQWLMEAYGNTWDSY